MESPTLRTLVAPGFALFLGLTLALPAQAVSAQPAAQATSQEAAARAFASQILAAFTKRDPTAIDRLIDWEAILTTALPDSFLERRGYDRAARAEFLRGARNTFRPGLYKPRGFAARLMADAASMRVLRVRSVDGNPRVLLRSTGDQNGLLYLDFDLRVRDGRLRAVDIFLPHTKSYFSAVMRELFEPLIPIRFSLFSRLLGSKDTAKEDLRRAGALVDALRTGKHQKVLELYAALPPRSRNKAAMLVRIQAAAEVGDPEYVAALTAFRRSFPDDPTADFLAIDLHFMKGNYARALETVDRVDAALGGDPFLDTYRANLTLALGKPKQAHALALAAHRSDRTLEDPLHALVTIAATTQDHVAAVRWLDALVKLANPDVDALLADESFAAFRASGPYERWRQQRAREAAAKTERKGETRTKAQGKGKNEEGE